MHQQLDGLYALQFEGKKKKRKEESISSSVPFLLSYPASYRPIWPRWRAEKSEHRGIGVTRLRGAHPIATRLMWLAFPRESFTRTTHEYISEIFPSLARLIRSNDSMRGNGRPLRRVCFSMTILLLSKLLLLWINPDRISSNTRLIPSPVKLHGRWTREKLHAATRSEQGPCCGSRVRPRKLTEQSHHPRGEARRRERPRGEKGVRWKPRNRFETPVEEATCFRSVSFRQTVPSLEQHPTIFCPVTVCAPPIAYFLELRTYTCMRVYIYIYMYIHVYVYTYIYISFLFSSFKGHASSASELRVVSFRSSDTCHNDAPSSVYHLLLRSSSFSSPFPLFLTPS